MQIWVWLWIHLLFAIEAALVVPALALGSRVTRLAGRFTPLARRRSAPAVVALLAIGLRVAVLPIEGVPEPGVHDEFSYLLAADTFLHGRLANPTHPLWIHFETMQEQHQPAYASMYPPAQGLLLAFGKRTMGSPFAAVVLSSGVMCGALCWALRAWFSPGWAFLAGILAAVRLGTFSYWADSYWGGALAATGGALIFGALPGLARTGSARLAALAAFGAVLLANTRPFEGGVFALAAGALYVWMRRRAGLRIVPARTVLAAAAVLLPAVALMGIYNWRVFGSPATMPYSVNRATYAVAQIFIWQPPRPDPPAYRHQAMRDFYLDWELKHFLESRTVPGYARMLLKKADKFWSFFIGPALTLPLLAAVFTMRSRRTRAFLALAAALAAAAAVTPWFVPHYAAPFTAAIWALLVQGLRALHARRRAAAAIVLLCGAMLAGRVAMALAPVPFVLNYPMTWASAWNPELGREKLAASLLSTGGRHLVIVRYGPGHDPVREYVFNAADIDASPVVWARDLGEEQNRNLLRHFSGRKVWVLEPDRQPMRLAPYAAATSAKE